MRWLRLIQTLILGVLVGIGSSCVAATSNPINPKNKSKPTWGATPHAKELARELAERFDLPPQWTLKHIAGAHPLPQVKQWVLPPATPSAKNWGAYRDRFIEPQRIEAGLRFWRMHEKALRRAERTYGVPAEMIVGIIGVETYYGRHMGKFSVLDVLTTLSLDFPSEHPKAAQRQAFFRTELGYFLQQSRKGASLQRKGSYAGAMGWPQFMPSSWSQYAVDFDGDGKIDLQNSSVDAIGSVAHYFARFGWKAGMPTHHPVDVTDPQADLGTLTAPDIVPTFTPQRMAELGARLDEQGRQHNGLLALVELQNGGDAPSYVAGTENFYVVTRYNWSSYYAMAVIELGRAVKTKFSPQHEHSN